jgi:predicted transcriptional regulator
MTASQLQKELIGHVKRTQDVALLHRLKLLLEKNAKNETYVMSPVEKQRVCAALMQQKAGDFYTNEEVFAELDEWLKE